jgi:hypothetical protein
LPDSGGVGRLVKKSSAGFVAALQALAAGFTFVACVAFTQGNVNAFVVDLMAALYCIITASSESA